MTFRRTKIVATLGPASSSPEVLEQLILAGMDVARLNFSHGTPEDHMARAKLVREIAAKHGRFVAARQKQKRAPAPHRSHSRISRRRTTRITAPRAVGTVRFPHARQPGFPAFSPVDPK